MCVFLGLQLKTTSFRIQIQEEEGGQMVGVAMPSTEGTWLGQAVLHVCSDVEEAVHMPLVTALWFEDPGLWF
ncbi:unnamed protein product [Lampetra planeri]